MKQKLLNALKEGHKNLGLSESAFERVATFGETFITSDEQIASFVEKALPMLKAEQSAADKVRTELNAKIKGLEGEKAELEAKLNGSKTEPNPEPKEPAKHPDIAAAVAAAVAAEMAKVVDPLKEKLQAFEEKQAKETAVAALDKFVSEWDYAKGFPKEASEAKRVAMKLYTKGGETMTGEQLIAEFREEFDPAVKRKGVTDFSQPFKSAGGAGSNSEEEKNKFEEEIKNALGIKEGE